ncbi:MAG: hypothetical protein M1421_07025 [Candidatus Eremiobacteraeota bacterium]|nr:hypothetical protein [Candidatus Eremiobacteraeota bacterium]MCL5055726.1 hypothetical protein [Bacillota bacterium]
MSLWGSITHAFHTATHTKEVGNGQTMVWEKVPGDVPGSRAYYIKVIDKEGNAIDAYKNSYDPKGNLIHLKPKMPDLGGNS